MNKRKKKKKERYKIDLFFQELRETKPKQNICMTWAVIALTKEVQI